MLETSIAQIIDTVNPKGTDSDDDWEQKMDKIVHLFTSPQVDQELRTRNSPNTNSTGL